MSIGAKTIFIY